MRLDKQDWKHVNITLSKRNLLSLLAKLNGYPPQSCCTLKKLEGKVILTVCAEDDHTHYANRGYPPGEVHPETAEAIKELLEKSSSDSLQS